MSLKSIEPLSALSTYQQSMGKGSMCMGVGGIEKGWGHGEGVHVHGVESMGKGSMCIGVGSVGKEST